MAGSSTCWLFWSDELGGNSASSVVGWVSVEGTSSDVVIRTADGGAVSCVTSFNGLMSNRAQPVGHAGISVSVAAGVGGVDELSDDVDRRWLGTLAGGGMMTCATTGCCSDDVDLRRARVG